MAALPQGAFVACKLREQPREKDLIVSRLKSSGEKNGLKVFSGNKKLMEYSPVKYNGKLMNSIWGFYNRYSPHNIKSNEIVSYDFDNQQQQIRTDYCQTYLGSLIYGMSLISGRFRTDISEGANMFSTPICPIDFCRISFRFAVANQAIAHKIAMAVPTGKEWISMEKMS